MSRKLRLVDYSIIARCAPMSLYVQLILPPWCHPDPEKVLSSELHRGDSSERTGRRAGASSRVGCRRSRGDRSEARCLKNAVSAIIRAALILHDALVVPWPCRQVRLGGVEWCPRCFFARERSAFGGSALLRVNGVYAERQSPTCDSYLDSVGYSLLEVVGSASAAARRRSRPQARSFS